MKKTLKSLVVVTTVSLGLAGMLSLAGVSPVFAVAAVVAFWVL